MTTTTNTQQENVEHQEPATTEEPQQENTAETEEQEHLEDDDKDDDRARKAAAEAKRYRLKLRQAEAELTIARAQVQDLEETLITYVGEQARLLKPEALLKAGYDSSRLRGEDGALIPVDTLTYDVRKFADEFGLAVKTGTPMPPDPAQHWDAIGDTSDEWFDSFKMH